MVGNANFHHVHHLSAKIPNYNLRAAHESHPMFRRTPVITLRSSIEAFRLKLWDEESESLVRFPRRRLRGRDRIAAVGEAAVLRSGQREPLDQLGS
jgi:omega-6 fatty acid desaturase (delta-12 desaturase)